MNGLRDNLRAVLQTPWQACRNLSKSAVNVPAHLSPAAASLDAAATGLLSEPGSQNIRSHIDRFSVFSAHMKCKDILAAIGYGVLRDPAQCLNLDLERLASFCRAVDQSMPPNDYHSKLHVADVVQLMLLQTLEGGALHEICEDLTVKISALMAAMVHDLRHPGLTNNFLRATNHVVVQEHGSDSPAEKMHVAKFIEILDDPTNDFLRPMGDENRQAVIDLVEKIVLATDMARHNEFLSKKCPVDPQERTEFHLQMAMKVCDFSHCLRSFRVHSKFVVFLKKEFYSQGDRELDLGLLVSIGMKRNETPVEIAQGQVDFLQAFVHPLLVKHTELSSAPLNDQILKILRRNIQSWALFCKPSERGPEYTDGRMTVTREVVLETVSAGFQDLHRQASMRAIALMYEYEDQENHEDWVIEPDGSLSFDAPGTVSHNTSLNSVDLRVRSMKECSGRDHKIASLQNVDMAFEALAELSGNNSPAISCSSVRVDE